MRKVPALLALTLLSAFCHADTINYQINVIGNWTETNPACVSNCTETVNMNYEFEQNLDVFNPTSPTNGIYGWMVNSTLQASSSGFLGSFINLPTSGLRPDLSPTDSQAMAFYTSLGFEVDLANPGPGLVYSGYNTGPAKLLIYDCYQVSTCFSMYPEDSDGTDYLFANNTTVTVVQVPAFDSAWELLLISTIACTVGLFVKHRPGLTPSRPCTGVSINS
jgi:hypothetical protein